MLPPAVLLGGEHIAVSVARSIAPLGAEVHAAGHGIDPIQASRFCTSFTPMPAGAGLGERYLEFLERGPRGAVLLPCDDPGLEVLAGHRELIEGWGYRGVEADDRVVLAMLDKERTYDISRRAGIPTPRTMTVRTRAEAEAAAGEFPYPCALKPVVSHRLAQVEGRTPKLYVAHDAEALLRWYSLAEEMGVEMLVTEIVPGGDEDFVSFYSYLLPDGEPLFRYTKHKLRQLPIDFGLTSYQESMWEPEVADLGLRFFQAAGLRGVGNVEFKRDARTGEWKIIECNHRFTLANELVRRSGIDIPRIAYCRAAGLPAPAVNGYRLGVRMWKPIEDFKAMRQYRAAGRLTLRGWLRSLLRRWHFPMLRLSDPGPTFHSVVRVRVTKRLPARLRRSR